MISGFRLMWLMVMFDLPVLTTEDRRHYRRFVDKLEDDGYFRMQYSVYIRPCATEENTEKHVNRVTSWLPPEGEVRVLKFTDKQWARMLVFLAREGMYPEERPKQFEFFDEEGEVLPAVASESSPSEGERAPPDPLIPEVSQPDLLAGMQKAMVRIEKRAARQRKKPSGPKNPSFDFFD